MCFLKRTNERTFVIVDHTSMNEREITPDDGLNDRSKKKRLALLGTTVE